MKVLNFHTNFILRNEKSICLTSKVKIATSTTYPKPLDQQLKTHTEIDGRIMLQ